MQNVNTYLNTLITTVPEYVLTPADQKQIAREGIEAYIFNKLNSSKFRSSKMSADVVEEVRSKIQYCVSHKQPLHLSLPFGSYKRVGFPTAPGIDWAEVFNMVWLREYLAPIAAAYEHGVLLTYFSVGLFVEEADRIPQSDVDFYASEFASLVKYMNKYMPKCLKFEFRKLEEEISQKDALKKIAEAMPQLQKNWDELNDDAKKLKVKRALVSLNVEVTKTDIEDLDPILLHAILVHDGFSGTVWSDENTPWAFADDMIALGHSYTNGWAIHVKSSRSSRVNFWVGMGVLLERTGEYIPSILSYEQYVESEEKLKKENVDVFKGEYSNLDSIPVFAS